MKRLHNIHLILFCFCFESIFSQAPQSIPYQAVARDNLGLPIANQNVSLRFSIHNMSPGGTVVFSETHSATTNQLGLFTVDIGLGVVVSGSFTAINWGSGSKFIQLEIDATGGSSYTDMGTTQILSVPYAIYANSSGGTAGGDLFGTYPNPGVSRINGSPLGTTTGASTGQVLEWSGTNWTIGTDNNSGGTVTSVAAGSGLSGGTITTSGTISMPNVGTAGTYGSATEIPVITTDSKGRISSVTTASNVRADTILLISEGDFVCRLSSDVITRYGNFGASMTTYTDGNLYAPVKLPHRVTVKKITVYYIDDHGFINFDIGFYRKDPSNLATTTLVSTSTSGINGAIRTIVWNTPILIDNAFAYYINIVPNNLVQWPPAPDQCGILGAKFEYEY